MSATEWAEERIVVTPDKVADEPLEWQKQGLSFTASGYGKRIPTTKMVYHDRCWRRVYCAIFSNIGTCYIMVKGKKHIVEGL